MRSLILAAALLLTATPALAADDPAFEISLGGSFGGIAAKKLSVDSLTKRFGTPTSTRRVSMGSGCELRWSGVALKAFFFNFGTATGSPCKAGTFTEARMTSKRWYTSKIRIGDSAAKARRISKQTCVKNRSCSVTGHAISLHPSDCAGSNVPTVIAVVARGKVVGFAVESLGCE